MRCGGVVLPCLCFLPGKAKMMRSTWWNRSGKRMILIQRPSPVMGYFGNTVQLLILSAKRCRCVLWMDAQSAPSPPNALRVDLYRAASTRQDSLVVDLG